MLGPEHVLFLVYEQRLPGLPVGWEFFFEVLCVASDVDHVDIDGLVQFCDCLDEGERSQVVNGATNFDDCDSVFGKLVYIVKNVVNKVLVHAQEVEAALL